MAVGCVADVVQELARDRQDRRKPHACPQFIRYLPTMQLPVALEVEFSCLYPAQHWSGDEKATVDLAIILKL